MSTHRRSFLVMGGAMVAVAVPGCTDSQNSDKIPDDGDGLNIENTEPDADNDGVPDSEDDFPNDPNRSAEETNSGLLDIAEDEWVEWDLEFREETHVEYEMVVRDGPAIDVFLFDEVEYEHYEAEERAKYYSEVSDLDTVQAEGSGWLESGNYRLVADNTNYGEAAPPTNLSDDVAEVEYTLSLSR